MFNPLEVVFVRIASFYSGHLAHEGSLGSTRRVAELRCELANDMTCYQCWCVSLSLILSLSMYMGVPILIPRWNYYIFSDKMLIKNCNFFVILNITLKHSLVNGNRDCRCIWPDWFIYINDLLLFFCCYIIEYIYVCGAPSYPCRAQYQKSSDRNFPCALQFWQSYHSFL